MGNALVSSGYRMVTAITFIGMGSIATEQVFQWLSNNPKAVRASQIISRLMDDIVSNEVINNNFKLFRYLIKGKVTYIILTLFSNYF